MCLEYVTNNEKLRFQLTHIFDQISSSLYPYMGSISLVSSFRLKASLTKYFFFIFYTSSSSFVI